MLEKVLFVGVFSTVKVSPSTRFPPSSIQYDKLRLSSSADDLDASLLKDEQRRGAKQVSKSKTKVSKRDSRSGSISCINSALEFYLNNRPEMAEDMPNYVGFEDKNWYKIRSVGDNNVIALAMVSNKFIITTQPDEDVEEDFKRFQAVQQASGKFRIVSKVQSSSSAVQVWDYLYHRKVLIQKKESSSDKFTQSWESENVPGYDSLYLVQSGNSVDTQILVKNMGPGQPIKLLNKTNKHLADPFTHWNLELQDMPN